MSTLTRRTSSYRLEVEAGNHDEATAVLDHLIGESPIDVSLNDMSTAYWTCWQASLRFRTTDDTTAVAIARQMLDGTTSRARVTVGFGIHERTVWTS